MTQDQYQHLYHTIWEVRQSLLNLADTIPAIPSQDDYEANQLIAGTRTQLHEINLKLFSLFETLRAAPPKRPNDLSILGL